MKWGEGFDEVFAELRGLHHMHCMYFGFLKTTIYMKTSPPSHFTTILCFYVVQYNI
jgi:hypothetical protein